MPVKRPADREITKRLNEAKEFLKNRHGLFANPAIAGLELLAFRWLSSKCAKQMYIKFVLKNERYYYVSLHQSRSTEQKGED